jgi:hypothetical protein
MAPSTYHFLEAPLAIDVVVTAKTAYCGIVETYNTPRLLVFVGVASSFRDERGRRRGGAILGTEGRSCGEPERVEIDTGSEPSERGKAGGNVVFEF